MQNKNLKQFVGAAALAAMVSLTLAQSAFAYSYSFVNSSGANITRIYIHTVSGLCKNKNWTGSFSSTSGTLSISPQAACLVEAVEAWDDAGKHYSNSWQLGFAGTQFTIHDDGTISK